jgi:hypothetical protein
VLLDLGGHGVHVVGLVGMHRHRVLGLLVGYVAHIVRELVERMPGAGPADVGLGLASSIVALGPVTRTAWSGM